MIPTATRGSARVRTGLIASVVALVLLGACMQTEMPSDRTGAASTDRAQRFAQDHGLLDLPRTVVRIERAAAAGVAQPALMFEVLVAETSASRSRGLQGVTSLPPDVGMLFVFPAPSGPGGSPGFWMLDTLLPLDIVFADAGTIVGIATMTPCLTRPCPVTHPGRAYDIALEVAAGGLVGTDVALGDRLVVESWAAR